MHDPPLCRIYSAYLTSHQLPDNPRFDFRHVATKISIARFLTAIDGGNAEMAMWGWPLATCPPWCSEVFRWLYCAFYAF